MRKNTRGKFLIFSNCLVFQRELFGWRCHNCLLRVQKNGLLLLFQKTLFTFRIRKRAEKDVRILSWWFSFRKILFDGKLQKFIIRCSELLRNIIFSGKQFGATHWQNPKVNFALISLLTDVQTPWNLRKQIMWLLLGVFKAIFCWCYWKPFLVTAPYTVPYSVLESLLGLKSVHESRTKNFLGDIKAILTWKAKNEAIYHRMKVPDYLSPIIGY